MVKIRESAGFWTTRYLSVPLVRLICVIWITRGGKFVVDIGAWVEVRRRD